MSVIMLGKHGVTERNGLALPDGGVIGYCGGSEHSSVFIVTIIVTILPPSFFWKNMVEGVGFEPT
ncbi:hypothetical protein ACMAUO_15950 [Gluconacetobacter sp. Hr-1-5]|uniref:hypothetical protein n=1 Tax=Gluconacetobacter sp. Hr-1-5 TaxID=3395370 RepID=UPI003B51B5B4